MCREVSGWRLKLHCCTPGLVRASAGSTPYKGTTSPIPIETLLLLLLFTAVGLSPDGSGYFTCIQNTKLVNKIRYLLAKHETEKKNVSKPTTRPRRRWKVILRWIFRKWDVVSRTESSWLRRGTGGGHL